MKQDGIWRAQGSNAQGFWMTDISYICVLDISIIKLIGLSWAMSLKLH